MNRKLLSLLLLLFAVILFMSLFFEGSTSYAWDPKLSIKLKGHDWDRSSSYQSEDQFILVSINHNPIIIFHNCKPLFSARFREKDLPSSSNLKKKNGEITHGKLTNGK